jgi:hypothetical protein
MRMTTRTRTKRNKGQYINTRSNMSKITDTQARANIIHHHSLDVEKTRLQMELANLESQILQAADECHLDYANYSAKGLAEEYTRMSYSLRGIRTGF